MRLASRYLPPLALMGLIFFLSAQPSLDSGLGWIDLVGRKLIHFGSYALLWFLWWRPLRTTMPAPRAALLSLVLPDQLEVAVIDAIVDGLLTLAGRHRVTVIGGNITLLTELCEKTRADAFELVLQHAQALGANGVVGLRYDATEVMQGVTEVLCYGTAVIVAPE